MVHRSKNLNPDEIKNSEKAPNKISNITKAGREIIQKADQVETHQIQKLH